MQYERSHNHIIFIFFPIKWVMFYNLCLDKIIRTVWRSFYFLFKVRWQKAKVSKVSKFHSAVRAVLLVARMNESMKPINETISHSRDLKIGRHLAVICLRSLLSGHRYHHIVFSNVLQNISTIQRCKKEIIVIKCNL